MPRIPEDVIPIMMKYCLENGYAMMETGDAAVSCLIIADKKFSPDQVGIIIAHLLLRQVITGELRESNARADTVIMDNPSDATH